MGRVVVNVNDKHVRIRRFAVKGKDTVSARQTRRVATSRQTPAHPPNAVFVFQVGPNTSYCTVLCSTRTDMFSFLRVITRPTTSLTPPLISRAAFPGSGSHPCRASPAFTTNTFHSSAPVLRAHVWQSPPSVHTRRGAQPSGAQRRARQGRSRTRPPWCTVSCH